MVRSIVTQSELAEESYHAPSRQDEKRVYLDWAAGLSDGCEVVPMARPPARRLQLAAGFLGSTLALAVTAPAMAQDRAFAEAVRYLHDRVVSCWNVPPGAAPAGTVVRIRFELDRDGAVTGDPVLDQPLETGAARLAESARRAVIRCAPYDGLKRYGAQYQRWRDIVLNFRQPE
jgi:hypothetical protein